MSDKEICPGCNSYTNSIYTAIQEGKSCPVCGLSADAMIAVHAARQRYEESALSTELEHTLVKLGRAERDRDLAQDKLRKVQAALNRIRAEIQE